MSVTGVGRCYPHPHSIKGTLNIVTTGMYRITLLDVVGKVVARVFRRGYNGWPTGSSLNPNWFLQGAQLFGHDLYYPADGEGDEYRAKHAQFLLFVDLKCV